jgi:hypothetical protein
MKRPQWVIGFLALICLGVALNVLVWQQEAFSLWVIVPLLASAGLGLLWVVIVVATLGSGSDRRGRGAGALGAVVGAVLFLGICIVVYAFTLRYDREWDLTQEGRRALSTQTVQVLESMTEPVKVLCFFLAVEDEFVAIARDKTMRFLDRCQAHTPLLEVELIDPQAEAARIEALNLTHASPLGTVVLQSGQRQRVITLSGASPRLEERDFTNALVNVLRNTRPKICFLTGHGERSVLDEDERKGASMFGNVLKGEGYEVEPVAIRLTQPELPAGCDLLVIHGLRGDLQPAETQLLDRYLREGGRLLLLLDPPLSATDGFMAQGQLLPWIKGMLGLEIGMNIAITDQQKSVFDVQLSSDAVLFEGVEEDVMKFTGAFYNEHPITRGFDQVMLFSGARTVTLTENRPADVSANILLRTTPDYWAETDLAMITQQGTAGKSLDEIEGSLPVAAAVSLKTDVPAAEGSVPRDARIVVVGNATFAANAQISVPGNFNFILNTVAWLTESENLIAIRPTGLEDTPLVFSNGQRRTLAWVSTLFTTQVVAVAGLAVWLLRRRRQ